MLNLRRPKWFEWLILAGVIAFLIWSIINSVVVERLPVGETLD